MSEDEILRIVAEVTGRLAVRLGADGRRGSLIAVFTGATVGFNKAVQQIRGLVLDGYRISLVLSQAAEHLYASVLKDQLSGFPHITWLESGKWLSALNEARAVVVPLLSVDTLSKVSLLIADTLAGNVILHALFMGKKVIAARNGADPAGSGREALGFNRGSLSLKRALLERFRIVEDYGCFLTDTEELRSRVNLVLSEAENSPAGQENLPARSVSSIASRSGKVVTAADIRHAHSLGVDLGLSPAAVVTPLARELAARYGVALVEQPEL
jgi:hypothetical protein